MSRRNEDVPVPDPGPDILTMIDDPVLREHFAAERREQQMRLIAPLLPARHLAKVDDIPLPPELANWDRSRGLLLHGPRGTGKTQAVTRLVVEAVKELRHQAPRVAFVSTSMLFADLRRQMNDKELEVPAVERMRKASLVVLEDLGKERPSPWVHEQTFVLFDDLYARDVELLVTTNLQSAQLEDRIGEYALDRLREMVTPIYIGGESHRANPNS